MRILVLGGTVYLSAEIAKQASARGHDVTVAARGMTIRPLADTVTAWHDWAQRSDSTLTLRAHLSRPKGTEVLNAWRASPLIRSAT